MAYTMIQAPVARPMAAAPALLLNHVPKGQIWARAPTPGKDGLVMTAHSVKNPLRPAHNLSFTAVCTNDKGSTFAAVDERGNVVLFHVVTNRYLILDRAGVYATSVGFVKQELVVGFADCSLRVYDPGTGKVLFAHKNHPGVVAGIAAHRSASYAVTYSSEAVVLWDLLDWTKKRTLDTGGVAVLGAAFVSTGDTLITAFADDTLWVWDSTSLSLTVKLSPSSPAAAAAAAAVAAGVNGAGAGENGEESSAPHLQCFAASANGHYCVAGGRSDLLHVWDLRSHTLLRHIKLPADAIPVIQCAFVAGSNVCVVMSPAVTLCLDIVSPTILSRVGSPAQPPSTCAMAPTGRHLTVLNCDGTLAMYDVGAIEGVAVKARLNSSGRKSGKGGRGGQAETQTTAGGLQIHQVEAVDDNAAPGNQQTMASRSGGNPLHGVVSSDTRHSLRRSASAAAAGGGGGALGVSAKNTGGGGIGGSLSARGGLRPHAAIDRNTKERKLRVHMSGLKSVPDPTPWDKENAEDVPLHGLASKLTKAKHLSKRHLRDFIRVNGSLPPKHRLLGWRFLLSLPENATAHSCLARRGVSTPFGSDIVAAAKEAGLPVVRGADRLVHALCHWSPVCTQLDYLYSLVSPFATACKGDDLMSFEVVLTFLLNMGHGWFDCLPAAPVPILEAVDKLVAHFDPPVVAHFQSHGISAEEYAWPMLRSGFGRMLPQEEWEVLMDHILASDPPHAIFACVAFVHLQRGALRQVRTRSDLVPFHSHPTSLSVSSVVQTMYRLYETCPPHLFPNIPQLTPLPKGSYPAFDRYPVCKIESFIQERNLIRLQEEELNTRKAVEEDLVNRTVDMQKHTDKIMRQQQDLMGQEIARAADEERVAKERLAAAAALNNSMLEQRLHRLTLVEASNNKIASHLNTVAVADAQAEGRRRDMRELERQLSLEGKAKEEQIRTMESQAHIAAVELDRIKVADDVKMAHKWRRAAAEEKVVLEGQIHEQGWARDDAVRSTRMSMERERIGKDVMERDVERMQSAETHASQLSDLKKRLAEGQLEQDRVVRRSVEEVKEEIWKNSGQLKDMAEIRQREEDQGKQRLERERKEWADSVTAERQAKIDGEKVKLQRAAEERTVRLQDLEREQRLHEHREAIASHVVGQQEEVSRQERAVQEALLQLQAKSKADEQAEMHILFVKEEEREKASFQRALKEAEWATVQEERAKFRVLQQQLLERHKVQEAALMSQHEAKMAAILQQREGQMRSLDSEWREGGQSTALGELQELNARLSAESDAAAKDRQAQLDDLVKYAGAGSTAGGDGGGAEAGGAGAASAGALADWNKSGLQAGGGGAVDESEQSIQNAMQSILYSSSNMDAAGGGSPSLNFQLPPNAQSLLGQAPLMTSEVNLNAQNMGGISSEDEFAGMLPSSSDSTLDLQPLGKP